MFLFCLMLGASTCLGSGLIFNGWNRWSAILLAMSLTFSLMAIDEIMNPKKADEEEDDKNEDEDSFR